MDAQKQRAQKINSRKLLLITEDLGGGGGGRGREKGQ